MRDARAGIRRRVVVLERVGVEDGHGALVGLVYRGGGVALVHLDAQAVLLAVDHLERGGEFGAAEAAFFRVGAQFVVGLDAFLNRGFRVAEDLPDVHVVAQRGVGLRHDVETHGLALCVVSVEKFFAGETWWNALLVLT